MSESVTETLEKSFAAVYGVRHVISTSSGTSAYLTALLALGLRPHSEIIVAAYGWPQLMAAPAALGLKVRMVDCDVEGRMDPVAVEAAVSPRTGAIVICHLFGNPVDAAAIAAIAAGRQIPVIEDCSQSLLASLRGRRVGTWGQLAFASLGAHKMLSAGEGGLLWADRHSLYGQAIELTQHCSRADGPAAQNALLTRSLSLRMHPKGAEIALQDLQTLETRVTRVSAGHELLRGLLRDVPGLRSIGVLPDARAMWQHFPLIVDNSLRPNADDALWWEAQPAYLLSDSGRYPRAREFSKWVRFISSGRDWEAIDEKHVREIADRIRTRVTS